MLATPRFRSVGNRAACSPHSTPTLCYPLLGAISSRGVIDDGAACGLHTLPAASTTGQCVVNNMYFIFYML